MLVYGDTNSTLAGRAGGRGRGVPLAHVEAGLRSGDLTMPEERNRIEVDRARGAALLPRRALARDAREPKASPGEIEVVGDVMADASRLFAPVARERSAFSPARARAAARTSSPPSTARRTSTRRGCGGSSTGSAASTSRSSSRPTRARAPRSQATARARRRRALIEPLGYLDFAALASQARVIVTDSGGLQKEAYWYGVPCVTLRPSTEWVDTVAAGANVLVDDDPDAIAAAVADARDAARSAAALRRRPRLASGSRRGCSVPLRAPGARSTAAWDVAIVGAGYVGVPLAQVVRRRRPLASCSSTSTPSASTQLNRGESYIEDVPSRDARRRSSTTGASPRRPTTTSSATPTRS